LTSYIYVPGLARDDNGAAAPDAAAFRHKVRDRFQVWRSDLRSPHLDQYMLDMVAVLIGKGALPLDCSRTLRWVQISGMAARPAGAQTSKAMHRLGANAGNVLARTAGARPVPIATTLRDPDAVPGAAPLPPCNAHEFLGQPLPSSADNPRGPLSVVGHAPRDASARGAPPVRDTLYVVGHAGVNGNTLMYKYEPPGNHRGGPTCGAQSHFIRYHVDPVVLASLLISEGLAPGQPIDIAVMACFSGGFTNAKLQTVQPYAQRLAATLTARGFDCHVYGANGMALVKPVSGRNEVHVAASAVPTGKRIELDEASAQPKLDAPGQPFYRRFFRMFS
jgi:hypothetical protein